jgi:hypothetical protein
MNWQKITLYDGETIYWICGVYKVVSYRPGEYVGYYFRDGDRNWGWRVAEPPTRGEFCNVWPTLESAQRACEIHSETHEPSLKTIGRAGEVTHALCEEWPHEWQLEAA